MLLNGKPIDDIIESDLQALIDNQVSEKKTIDYKRELKCSKDNEKKEFLYDVSSFANASGGHLIFGIEENNGIPINIFGIEINDIDKEKLRLEDIIRNGIAPRIPVYTIHPVSLQNGKYVIIIDIPRSFALPHMVTFQNSSRFYSRNSAGKYQLDVNEIRTAFTVSQTLLERIRDFRRERLSMIIADENPVNLLPLDKSARLVLHLIPLNAFDINTPYSISIGELEKFYSKNNYQNAPLFAPPSSNNWDWKYNFDGFLTYNKASRLMPIYSSYLQIFRNGIIEATTLKFFKESMNILLIPDKKVIKNNYEQEIIHKIKNYLSLQNILNIPIPVFIFLNVVGVKFYAIETDKNFDNSSKILIDRDNLILPEIMIEDYNVDLPKVMKPIFDAVWNAAGYPQSMNYDQQGNWKGNQR